MEKKQQIQKYWGRIIGTAFGLLLALICIIFSFWYAILTGLFIGAGYLVGRYHDGYRDVRQSVDQLVMMILNKR